MPKKKVSAEQIVTKFHQIEVLRRELGCINCGFLSATRRPRKSLAHVMARTDVMRRPVGIDKLTARGRK